MAQPCSLDTSCKANFCRCCSLSINKCLPSHLCDKQPHVPQSSKHEPSLCTHVQETWFGVSRSLLEMTLGDGIVKFVYLNNNRSMPVGCLPEGHGYKG
jgi:hypothetical protein